MNHMTYHVKPSSKLTMNSFDKADTAVPTAACQQSSVNSLTSLFSATTISNPTVNKATVVTANSTTSRLPVKCANKTTPVLPEHKQQRSLRVNVSAAVSAAVTARIERRRQLAVNRITEKRSKQQPVKATRPVKAPVTATKSPASLQSSPSMPPRVTATTTAPASTSPIPSMLPRAVTPVNIPAVPTTVARPAAVTSTASTAILPSTRKYGWINITVGTSSRQGGGATDYQIGHVSAFVEMSSHWSARPSRILTHSIGCRPRSVIDAKAFRPVFLSLRKRSRRGRAPYCCGRPWARHENGEFMARPYVQPMVGKVCPCHGQPKEEYHVRPGQWATTGAEDDVDPHRPRVVRFGGSTVVGTFEPWYLDAYGEASESTDMATQADDDLEAPPSPPPASKPKPPSSPHAEPPPSPKSKFDAIWEECMATPFEDDED